MQTFLPYPDFAASAEVLDRRRLGKQRVEALQVVRALTRPGYGWQNHPAVAMWRGYPEALARYGLDICRAWSARGGADSCAGKIVTELADTGIPEARSQAELEAAGELPPWLGDADVHRSHQAALVRKDAAHYRHWFPDVSPELPYVWPRSDRAGHG
ncbi:MSMEG_6728 family protein [Amycolatopsis jiangsuensis]|uniref:Cytoplasmic protein n=1 Tax=Amycolatopsis jiangsuensis TaxID=1181879 RepID=A0A840ITD0_9PSEU|nr:MSMEG_6728 family protein [Amycolatopsis jiangsuensis]MBB4684472.1 hypothetical protein [Amycolatopsis jiangsuensis]